MSELFQIAVGGVLYLPIVLLIWAALRWAEETGKSFGWVAYGLGIAAYLLNNQR